MPPKSTKAEQTANARIIQLEAELKDLRKVAEKLVTALYPAIGTHGEICIGKNCNVVADGQSAIDTYTAYNANRQKSANE